VNERANARISLKKDSTFIYNYQFDLAGAEVKGTWKTDPNGYIIFNSDKRPPEDSIIVNELIINNNDNKKFTVTDLQNEPLGGAAITFDDKKDFGIVMNEEGEGFVSNNVDFNQFTVYYLGYNYTYKVINKESTLFKVQIYYPSPADAYYIYFINEKWQLKGNKLIDLKPEKKIKYKKVPDE
jgi:hypothetical protein